MKQRNHRAKFKNVRNRDRGSVDRISRGIIGNECGDVAGGHGGNEKNKQKYERGANS
jgi:hypothetical protein